VHLEVVAGVDLGGTSVNYTLVDRNEKFLIEGLCEHPALAKQGPAVCLKQITDGLDIAISKAGISLSDVVAVGLDTPGPASASGRFCTGGPTNFQHKDWSEFDIREGLAHLLAKPVSYLNDANAAALWGHYSLFGSHDKETSISSVIGTGNGGGIILGGEVIKGKNGFGAELGHVLIPYQGIEGIAGLTPRCNCGRIGDLESLCSLTAIENNLLPFYLSKYPGHELGAMSLHDAAKLVRGMAVKGDALARDVFRVQAHALGLFFDEMINTFDPDALIVGGGALETKVEFQEWFVSEIRKAMPVQREEQVGIPIHIMPNGDTAGARGAAIEALKFARHGGLA
jgi:glucokinase